MVAGLLVKFRLSWPFICLSSPIFYWKIRRPNIGLSSPMCRSSTGNSSCSIWRMSSMIKLLKNWFYLLSSSISGSRRLFLVSIMALRVFVTRVLISGVTACWSSLFSNRRWFWLFCSSLSFCFLSRWWRPRRGSWAVITGSYMMTLVFVSNSCTPSSWSHWLPICDFCKVDGRMFCRRIDRGVRECLLWLSLVSDLEAMRLCFYPSTLLTLVLLLSTFDSIWLWPLPFSEPIIFMTMGSGVTVLSFSVIRIELFAVGKFMWRTRDTFPVSIC